MSSEEIDKLVKKGDPYDQIREAERRGILSEVLLNALQDVSDESWEDFSRQWKSHWLAYLVSGKSEE